MKKIIEVLNVSKSYKDVKAVDNVDFYVEEGKLFSFLGPNGAGKSTTIDMICTFLKQDKGEIIIDGLSVGQDDDKIRNLIGVVFQDSVLDNILTVEENLKSRGSLYGLKGAKLNDRVLYISQLTGITDYYKRPYGKLSGGQRRRCDIARALIHTPKILFLDEPTTGLDPQTRRYVWDIISHIQKETNMTIFLTTHYMEEASNSDYIIIIDGGKIVAKGTPTQLKDTYTKDELRLYSKDLDALETLLKFRNIDFRRTPNSLDISIKSTKESLTIIENTKDEISDFEVVKGSMDNVFLNITGRSVRE